MLDTSPWAHTVKLKMCCHPHNQKYLMYHNAVRGGMSHWHR